MAKKLKLKIHQVEHLVSMGEKIIIELKDSKVALVRYSELSADARDYLISEKAVELLKVQSNHLGDSLLVYNEERTQQVCTRNFLKWEPLQKYYYWGQILGYNFTLVKRADWQYW